MNSINVDFVEQRVKALHSYFYVMLFSNETSDLEEGYYVADGHYDAETALEAALPHLKKNNKIQTRNYILWLDTKRIKQEYI